MQVAGVDRQGFPLTQQLMAAIRVVNKDGLFGPLDEPGGPIFCSLQGILRFAATVDKRHYACFLSWRRQCLESGIVGGRP